MPERNQNRISVSENSWFRQEDFGLVCSLVSTPASSAGRKATEQKHVGTNTPSWLLKLPLKPHSPFPPLERIRESPLLASQEGVGGAGGDHPEENLTVAAAMRGVPVSQSLQQPKVAGRGTAATGSSSTIPQAMERVPQLAWWSPHYSAHWVS